jgi:pimeloyl-ACP methyl ester carboxylesterase
VKTAAAVVAVVAVLAGSLAVPTAASAVAQDNGPCVTSQLQQVPGGSTSLAGSVPVVFIHGIISKPGMWKPTTPGSIAYQAARISGITAWTFNYQPESLDWVTNPAIGPAFASRLACLGTTSGHKVIVVAHSMGGLATQYALAQPDPDGGTVGSHVAEVITVGTPYQGSEILTAMQLARLGTALDPPDYLEAALGEAVLSACAGHTSGICALPAVLPSQVGTALELNSPAIAQLPLWPAGLPVLDIAGDMGLLIGVGHIFVVHRFDVGDVAVTAGSATAHDTAGAPVIKHCNSLKLLGAIYGNPGPCFHTRLVNDADIIGKILTAIQQYLASVTGGSLASYTGTWHSPVSGVTLVILPSGIAALSWDGNAVWAKFIAASGKLNGVVTGVYATNTGFHVGGPITLSTSSNGMILLNPHGAADYTTLSRQQQPPPTGYGHPWYVHGAQLTIDGQTGAMTWNNGPCGQTMCTGHAAITFVSGPVGISGTITRTWYTQGNGDPAPPGYQPPASVKPGDQFAMAYVNQHIAIEIWTGTAASLNSNYGNPYWCDTYAETHGWHQYCGA